MLIPAFLIYMNYFSARDTQSYPATSNYDVIKRLLTIRVHAALTWVPAWFLSARAADDS